MTIPFLSIGDSISDDGMVDLSKALKKNSTLAILDLGGLASKMNVIKLCINNLYRE